MKGIDISSKLPDDVGQGGGDTTPEVTPPVDAGAAAGASAGGSPAGGSPAGDTGGGAAAADGSAAGAAAAQQQAAWSLREALKSAGVSTPETVADDKAAWEFLQAQIRQQQQLYSQEVAAYRQLAEWGQYYQANKDKIEQALRQTPAQTAQPAATPNPWQPPAWNDADLQGIIRKEDGSLAVAPGYAPDLIQRYQNYQRWQAEKLSSFLRDPAETLKPVLGQSIQEIVEKAIQERLRGYDEQNFAQSYVQQQGSWMFEKDNFGRPLNDAFGRPVLSPAGQRFWHYTQMAQQQGITDARAQQAFAQNMTELESLRVFYQQKNAQGGAQVPGQAALPAQGQPTNDQLKAAAVAGGARKLPGGGGAPPPSSSTDPNAPRPRAGFGAQLQENLRKQGITSVN